ncbi:hypothetical protein [Neoroseomonas lacus]|uniref:Uncharacterized protein n=1 Tax=Neoroseomonas lacus TaxID=287609 RepID=A0A917NTN3_9PROT|nr:hypothetical protein [Neoroseomonas lacus]GGJ24091.1 hypothetical protein GCM10011320_34220 [Neoroseomonas lacus]
MSDTQGELTPAILAGWIMAYLCAQPAASDTVRGVREWWLSRISPPPPDEAVLAILEDLARAGLVLRQVNSDRTVMWSAGPGFPCPSRDAAR